MPLSNQDCIGANIIMHIYNYHVLEVHLSFTPENRSSSEDEERTDRDSGLSRDEDGEYLSTYMLKLLSLHFNITN